MLEVMQEVMQVNSLMSLLVSEICQSRGAGLKREDLAFLEQGRQPPLTRQTPSQLARE